MEDTTEQQSNTNTNTTNNCILVVGGAGSTFGKVFFKERIHTQSIN